MASILLIDDSPAVLAVVKEALAPDKHTVRRVKTITNLPFILQTAAVDLILLDLQMSGFSGVTIGDFLQRHLRAAVPVVIYSSRPAAELDAAARQIHATAAVPKETPAPELRQLVKRLLSRPRPAGAHR